MFENGSIEPTAQLIFINVSIEKLFDLNIKNCIVYVEKSFIHSKKSFDWFLESYGKQ